MRGESGVSVLSDASWVLEEPPMGDTVDWQNLHPLSAALTQGIPIRALLLVKGPHARHRTA